MYTKITNVMTDLQRQIVEISIFQKQRTEIFKVSQKKHLLQGYMLTCILTSTC